MDETLKQRQDAARKLEQSMLEFFMQFGPAETLTVGDVKQIAAWARNSAFGLFEPR